MTKHNAFVVIAAISVVGFATLAAYAQNGIQPVQSLTVVDANGKKVGAVLGIGGDGNQNPVFNVVAFRVRKNLLTLGVLANGFLGSETNLYFTSFDCSGDPLISAAPNYPATLPDTASRAAVVGGRVFVPVGNTSQTVSLNSFLTSLNSPGNSSCQQQSFSTDVLPSQQVIDLGAIFSPPFSVVATPAQN